MFPAYYDDYILSLGFIYMVQYPHYQLLDAYASFCIVQFGRGLEFSMTVVAGDAFIVDSVLFIFLKIPGRRRPSGSRGDSSPVSVADSSASSEWVVMSSRTWERKEKKIEKAVLEGWKIHTQKEREIFEVVSKG